MELFDKNLFLQSEHFLLRPVKLTDAADLLRCYSDRDAVALMNTDSCSSRFLLQTPEEMTDCIRFWLRNGKETGYVRLTILDQRDGRAVGSCELLPRERLGPLKQVGLLRLDLMAAYETEEVLTELFGLFHRSFYEPLQYLMFKTPAAASLRRELLRIWGYAAIRNRRRLPFDGYWFRAARTLSLPYGCGGIACVLCGIEDCPECRMEEDGSCGCQG